MPSIYNIEMSLSQRELVVSIIQLLVNRLQSIDPTITYRDLAENVGTSYRCLGQPLLKMSLVIRQCPIGDVPSLNALVVYSSSHLPARDGLLNAEGGIIENNEQLRNTMNEMNRRAQEYDGWPTVITSIIDNIHD